MINLREISSENFYEVLGLRVAEHQKDFVSTVAEALAQAWLYYDTAFPFAIYADDVPVGFVMLGYYKSRYQYTLWKFLIDERHQNKGYSKQALKLSIDYLINTFNTKEVFTGVYRGNEIAKRLYISFGFKETGNFEDNMEELKYTCK
ncbi:MAG: GNAT family N-acetyltransferase [Clostridia bacterium]|nr:GNAT family N-acetyltransferase [Clostridia bacterium]